MMNQFDNILFAIDFSDVSGSVRFINIGNYILDSYTLA